MSVAAALHRSSQLQFGRVCLSLLQFIALTDMLLDACILQVLIDKCLTPFDPLIGFIASTRTCSMTSLHVTQINILHLVFLCREFPFET